MARSNSKGPAGAPATIAQPDPAAAQTPADSAGVTPSNGADTATSANAAGSGDGQSTDPAAASVSTAANGEAASDVQSGAASGHQGAGDPPIADLHNPREREGGPAAPPAEASASAGDLELLKGSQGLVIIDDHAFARTSLFRRLDFSAPEILDEDLEELIGQAAGLTKAEWDDLPEAVRGQAVDAMRVQILAGFDALRSVVELVTAPIAETEEVTAKSRDGKPLRRAGHVWTDKYLTVPLTPDQAKVVRNDPNLLLKVG